MSAILSAGVWDFLLTGGGHGNEAIHSTSNQLSTFLSLRQLQQQQAELEGGGTRDGLYEPGPIALSQVRTCMCTGMYVSSLTE